MWYEFHSVGLVIKLLIILSLLINLGALYGYRQSNFLSFPVLWFFNILNIFSSLFIVVCFVLICGNHPFHFYFKDLDTLSYLYLSRILLLTISVIIAIVFYYLYIRNNFFKPNRDGTLMDSEVIFLNNIGFILGVNSLVMVKWFITQYNPLNNFIEAYFNSFLITLSLILLLYRKRFDISLILIVCYLLIKIITDLILKLETSLKTLEIAFSIFLLMQGITFLSNKAYTNRKGSSLEWKFFGSILGIIVATIIVSSFLQNFLASSQYEGKLDAKVRCYRYDSKYYPGVNSSGYFEYYVYLESSKECKGKINYRYSLSLFDYNGLGIEKIQKQFLTTKYYNVEISKKDAGIKEIHNQPKIGFGGTLIKYFKIIFATFMLLGICGLMIYGIYSSFLFAYGKT